MSRNDSFKNFKNWTNYVNFGSPASKKYILKPKLENQEQLQENNGGFKVHLFMYVLVILSYFFKDKCFSSRYV